MSDDKYFAQTASLIGGINAPDQNEWMEHQKKIDARSVRLSAVDAALKCGVGDVGTLITAATRIEAYLNGEKPQ